MWACTGGVKNNIKPSSYGLLLSILIHTVIMAIPFSMIITKHFKDVELFVIDERPLPPVQEKKIKPKPKETPKEIIKEAQPQAELKAQPELKETEVLEPKTVEPSVNTERDDVPALLTPNPAPTPPSKIEEAKKPNPLEDVEFGSANGPRFLHREMPAYPIIARRLGKEGQVKLRLTIDEEGRLLNIEVIEGAGYGFTEAAVEAVKKSTFMPAMQDGKPVMSKALLQVKFILRKQE